MLFQKRVDQIVALRILLLFSHFPLSQGYDPTHKLSDTLYCGRTIVVVEGSLVDVVAAGRRLHPNAIITRGMDTPLFDELKAKITQIALHALPSSKLAEACQYALNQ